MENCLNASKTIEIETATATAATITISASDYSSTGSAVCIRMLFTFNKRFIEITMYCFHLIINNNFNEIETRRRSKSVNETNIHRCNNGLKKKQISAVNSLENVCGVRIHLRANN